MKNAFAEVNKNGKRMEVIYLSGDQTQEKASSETPEEFITIPLSEVGKYKTEYKLQHWPWLAVCKPDGTVLECEKQKTFSNVHAKGAQFFEDWIKKC